MSTDDLRYRPRRRTDSSSFNYDSNFFRPGNSRPASQNTLDQELIPVDIPNEENSPVSGTNQLSRRSGRSGNGRRRPLLRSSEVNSNDVTPMQTRVSNGVSNDGNAPFTISTGSIPDLSDNLSNNSNSSRSSGNSGANSFASTGTSYSSQDENPEYISLIDRAITGPHARNRHTRAIARARLASNRFLGFTEPVLGDSSRDSEYSRVDSEFRRRVAGSQDSNFDHGLGLRLRQRRQPNHPYLVSNPTQDNYMSNVDNISINYSERPFLSNPPSTVTGASSQRVSTPSTPSSRFSSETALRLSPRSSSRTSSRRS